MAMLPRSEENRLIRKARTGDGAAIEKLIRIHQEPLYAFMLRMTGRPEAAEDVTQEAFVRVLKNLDRFDSRFRFSTWVFTIAKRLHMNAVQKHKPVYDNDTVDARQGPDVTPGGVSERAESMSNVRDTLDQAMSTLSPLQKEIILLFHQQSWPITEIAVYLDMPEGTIKSHLFRARRRMKQFIQEDAALNQSVVEVWQ
ncbi:MAG: sigma-70 family RNA polymerase sigma factor [Phycisphaerales bacterium]|nr:MAG: sigma-70 family RNA polymerase sigma factor [Phycisphaerales bacterium]